MPTLASWRRPADPEFAEDWSAGAWRQHLLPSAVWPPVHPQHERHKGVPVDAPGEVRKFVGLGSYGTVVFRRAIKAAEAGFAVPVFGIRDGYLRMARLSPASVMSRRGTRALAEAVLRYLPWRAAAMQTGARADTAAVLELLRVNTQERFGPTHDAALLRLDRLARAAAAQPAVIIDGHLAPWEWLQTPRGVVKVDTAEHGDDHFQPGPQDIAWDVAGVLAEFAWTRTGAGLADRAALDGHEGSGTGAIACSGCARATSLHAWATTRWPPIPSARRPMAAVSVGRRTGLVGNSPPRWRIDSERALHLHRSCRHAELCSAAQGELTT